MATSCARESARKGGQSAHLVVKKTICKLTERYYWVSHATDIRA